MAKTRTFKQRPGFSDGIERYATGVYIRLSENQAEELERRAEAAGKTLKQFIRDLAEAAIQQMVPAK